MVGILVVTHGRLSESLIETANMFASESEGVEYVCFTEGQGVEDLKESVVSKLKEMESYEKILSFVDIPGGSPARVMSEQLIENPKLELITGVNLPLLVEAILTRNLMEMDELVKNLVDASRNSITNIGELLRN
jgi:mannose/fructose/sorbose-specific phosphotransferase system IIA component